MNSNLTHFVLELGGCIDVGATLGILRVFVWLGRDSPPEY